MKKEIILPEHIGDITLGQYQEYYKLTQRKDLSDVNFNRRKIGIFTELNFKDVGSIAQKDFKSIIDQIDIALNLTPKFEQRFFIDDIEFGMIPNMDKMSNTEYADTFLYPLSEENEEGDMVHSFENAHRLMAILCRPIVNEDKFKNYKIAKYNGTEEYGEFMKRTPMVYVNGIIDFFFHLAKELRISTQRYTEEVLAKERKLSTTGINGDGLLQSQS